MYNDITGKGNKIAAILEWFETLMEMLCMLCLVSLYLYRRLMTAGGEGASHVDDAAPGQDNAEFPPGWIFLMTRVSLIIHQVIIQMEIFWHYSQSSFWMETCLVRFFISIHFHYT